LHFYLQLKVIILNFIFAEKEATIKPKQKKGVKSENPFSFKKFLSGSSTKSGEERPVPETSSEKRTMPRKKVTTGDVNNIQMVSGDLPDFVQDHYSDKNALGSELIETSDTQSVKLSLPDFALDSTNVREMDDPRKRTPSLDNYLVTDDMPLGERNKDDVQISDDEQDSDHVNGSLLARLPDFISDAALNNDRSSEKGALKNATQSDLNVAGHESMQQVSFS